MPLVAHNDLPTFARLRQFGLEILPLDEAVHQDIRELHIGLLNMMPDAALAATEHQFINLVGNCNKIAQFYVYPFSLSALDRERDAREHIDRYYFDFRDLQAAGLDALIITGANVANPTLDQEPFWAPLMEVVQWAEHHTTSILCSCLATHALLKHHHGIERQLDPGPPSFGDACQQIDPDFPSEWGIAIDRFPASDLLKRYLGARYVEAYAECKRLERAAYLAQVPKEEFDWYL